MGHVSLDRQGSTMAPRHHGNPRPVIVCVCICVCVRARVLACACVCMCVPPIPRTMMASIFLIQGLGFIILRFYVSVVCIQPFHLFLHLFFFCLFFYKYNLRAGEERGGVGRGESPDDWTSQQYSLWWCLSTSGTITYKSFGFLESHPELRRKVSTLMFQCFFCVWFSCLFVHLIFAPPAPVEEEKRSPKKSDLELVTSSTNRRHLFIAFQSYYIYIYIYIDIRKKVFINYSTLFSR